MIVLSCNIINFTALNKLPEKFASSKNQRCLNACVYWYIILIIISTYIVLLLLYYLQVYYVI